jgi:hypothetical protein
VSPIEDPTFDRIGETWPPMNVARMNNTTGMAATAPTVARGCLSNMARTLAGLGADEKR